MDQYIEISGIDDKLHIKTKIKVLPDTSNYLNDCLFKPVISNKLSTISKEQSKTKIKTKTKTKSKKLSQKLESPKIESLKIESLKIESPKIESPKIESPKIESPKIIKNIDYETENSISDTVVKFNKEQTELVKYITDNIDSNKIITINGIAGSGKTFTILEMFDLISNKVKNRTLHFCAPTNSVITRNKAKYYDKFKEIFNKVEFLTVSTLLNEKLFYNNKGESYFQIVQKKSNPIFNSDIIIIDEVSMINPKHIDYIIEHKNSFNLCILLGDKNQLDPPSASELEIFKNIDLNLTQNMRCNNSNANIINNFMIQNIESYNTDFDYNKFLFELYNLFYKNKLNVFEVNYEFIEQFVRLHTESDCVIGNYTNKNCNDLNNKITKLIKSLNQTEMIDSFYEKQRILFKNKYGNWNNSYFAIIKNIKIKKYDFEKLTYSNLIQINKDIKHNLIPMQNMNEFCNEFTTKNNKLFKSQQLFNILLNITDYSSSIIDIFNEINKFKSVKINFIKLHNDSYIRVLNSEYFEQYNNTIIKIKTLINKLNKLKFSKKMESIKVLFNKYFIEGLWNLFNKYRIDIFANIECAFACTIHKLQGCSIEKMFVNLTDIFKVSEEKNKLKCLYTAFSRTIDDVYINLSFNPLCNCKSITKLKFSDTDGIYFWICANKKCCFYQSKSISDNCSNCSSCNVLYHNTFIKDKLCCKCYSD